MLSISLRFHCLSPDMFCTAFSHAKPPRNIHSKNNSRRITYGIGCVWGMPSLSPLFSLDIIQCLIVIPLEMNSPLAVDESGESRTKAKPRNRRQVLNATLAGISIHDVRKEISKLFEQLMPTKYCKSSEKVCPVGPP